MTGSGRARTVGRLDLTPWRIAVAARHDAPLISPAGRSRVDSHAATLTRVIRRDGRQARSLRRRGEARQGVAGRGRHTARSDRAGSS